jgi:hypothetical protein
MRAYVLHMFSYGAGTMVEQEPLQYVVEIYERNRHDWPMAVKAQVAFLTGGIAMWELTKERHPHERTRLLQGGRVLRDTHPPAPADYPGR